MVVASLSWGDPRSWHYDAFRPAPSDGLLSVSIKVGISRIRAHSAFVLNMVRLEAINIALLHFPLFGEEVNAEHSTSDAARLCDASLDASNDCRTSLRSPAALRLTCDGQLIGPNGVRHSPLTIQ
jgi:hypothetical protein